MAARSTLNKMPFATPTNTPDSTLTNLVWGLDWRVQFPQNLTPSIRVEILSYQKAIPVIAELFPEVYQLDICGTRFQDKARDGLKQRYYEVAGDFFVFYDNSGSDTVVGMAVGTLLDWSSYNFRNIAISQNYQEHGIYPAFFEKLAEILRKFGVDRIEGDVSPSNRHHIHVLNKMGYAVTAMSYSERWGVLLHITKYLNEQDENRTMELFSLTHASDSIANKRSTIRVKHK